MFDIQPPEGLLRGEWGLGWGWVLVGGGREGAGMGREGAEGGGRAGRVGGGQLSCIVLCSLLIYEPTNLSKCSEELF
jgi:hypothetical protein